ncbi:MAG: hypothetical protein GXY36_18185 [Chloroflexi bacterium]|nr:hypothetical protein [Chloroflexota bacterium]
MIIREPLVQSIYYYLHETSGDSPARRADRYEAFVSDTYRVLQSVAGWLAMPAPDLPVIQPWEGGLPAEPQLLMKTGSLQGRINATASLYVYALRNMLLLRVIVARPGEHEQSVWPMLNDALNAAPATPTWLHTTHYWCGIASRPPDDLEHSLSAPIRTPFGVLCLGQRSSAHVLVYPDARTESRAEAFMASLAPQIDWFQVQARYRLETYETHTSAAVHNQQSALDRVAQTVQDWTAESGARSRLQTVAPLHAELDTLEVAYNDMLRDLAATQAAAQEVRSLAAQYRQTLMQFGLWDAAPSVWEAQVESLAVIEEQIESDVQHIDAVLRRTELLVQSLQTRAALLQGERERLLVYLIAALGLAVVAVLIADTDLVLVLIRLLALAVVGGLVWFAWQRWLRERLP